MFTNTPYALAKAYGDIQQQMLSRICKKIKTLKEINWAEVSVLMKEYDKNLAFISKK